MNEEKSTESIEKYNRVLFNVNNFMVEQTETADYNQLVNTVVDQLDKLLRPIAITYNEYDEQNRTLRIKEVKANQGMLEIFLKVSGKKFSSLASPVDAQLYEEIKAERVKLVPTLHEATGRAVPKTVSSAVSKAIGINCYLGLAYVVDGQLYGTSAIALKDAPDHSVMNLLKTYAYYTSMSIKRIFAEETLRRSEQELRIITDNMTDVVAMADVEGNFTYISESNYHLSGYKPSELLGKNNLDLIHEDDLSAVGVIFQEGVMEGRKNARVEYRVHKKDDDYVWVETIGSVVLDDNGHPSGALLVSRDISDRKQAEEQVERLAQIADNAPSSILVHDYEGNLFYANEHTFHLYGYIKEEFLKLNLRDISAPESAELIPARMKEIEEKGEAEFEVRNVRKDRSTFPLQVYVKQTEWFGKPALLSVSTDITERKQAEEALRESESRYRKAQELGKVGNWEYNLKTAELWGSDEAKKIFEFDSDEDSFNIEEVESCIIARERVHQSLVDLIESSKPYNLEYDIITKNTGKIKTIISIAELEKDKDGKPLKVSGVIQDITDRKKAEEKIIHIGFHDQLTDLYNRHYFEACEEDLKKIPLLSVIMTDVNGLKLINDTYGHGAGDELLKKYADLLRKSFKQSDLIFRWGGDEFIVILKNTEQTKSWELCNRLVKYCGETFVKDIPLSISVGISSKLQGGNIDKAIQEAEDMMYKNKLIESKSSKNLIMKTLQQALAEKSFETKEHIDRMILIGRQFGEKLGLPLSELSRLETLTMLHDIGKINIDSHILLKETALSDEAWVEIKKHPEVGYRITRTAEEFAYIAEDILAHHERWDGKGYPQGLGGDSIPYLARILNVIDSFDVMSNGRPYKKKMYLAEIIEEIERCSGKQFDPDLAGVFVAFLKEEAMTYQQ